jgi:hypothetical protein
MTQTRTDDRRGGTEERRGSLSRLLRDGPQALAYAVSTKMFSPPRPGNRLLESAHPYYVIQNGPERRLDVWSGDPNGFHLLPLRSITYSVVRDDGPGTGTYLDYFLTLRHMYGEQPRTLLVGFGGGVIPYQWKQVFGMDIESVESDARVIEVARKFLPCTAGMSVVNGDGAEFVAKAAAAGRSYDIIIQDACDMFDAPAGLFQEGFIRDARAALSEKGVLSVNYWMSLRNLAMYGKYVGRLGKEFASVCRVETRDAMNVILVCSAMDREEMVGRISDSVSPEARDLPIVQSYLRMEPA